MFRRRLLAPGTAIASAYGIAVRNRTPGQQGFIGHPVDGTVTNAGTMNVVANAAAGGTFTTTTAGGATVTLANATASAAGIAVFAGANNMVINNSGVINVDAITNGGTSNATGILVQPFSAYTSAATDVLTINNSGDIIARISTDGGTTFHRGEAIDVSASGNPTVINLMGGNITGNIELQSDADAINVTTGETNFNGIVNSGCYDGAAIAAGGDNPALSSCGVGTLTIGDGAAAAATCISSPMPSTVRPTCS